MNKDRDLVAWTIYTAPIEIEGDFSRTVKVIKQKEIQDAIVEQWRKEFIKRYDKTTDKQHIVILEAASGKNGKALYDFEVYQCKMTGEEVMTIYNIIADIVGKAAIEFKPRPLENINPTKGYGSVKAKREKKKRYSIAEYQNWNKQE